MNVAPASAAVTEAFRRHARRVAPATASSWRLELRNGRSLSANATLTDGVLRMSAVPRVSATRSGLWALLLTNSRLPAFAKCVLDARTREPLVQVEVPLADGSTLDRVVSACELLLRAESACREEPADARTVAIKPDDPAPPWLEGWSAEAWPVSSLGDGRFGVDFESRDGQQRVVITTGRAEVRCTVELSTTTPEPTRRLALALCLLTASDLLPFARATALESGERDAMRFESVLPRDCAGADVERSVMTLAAASDQFGPEVRALSHGTVAKDYVALRDRRRDRAPRPPIRRVPEVLKRILQGG